MKTRGRPGGPRRAAHGRPAGADRPRRRGLPGRPPGARRPRGAARPDHRPARAPALPGAPPARRGVAAVSDAVPALRRRVGHRLEGAAVKRGEALGLEGGVVVGRRVAHVAVEAEARVGRRPPGRAMRRSRAVLAITEAAAIAALGASPPDHLRGAPGPAAPRRKPSTRQTSGQGAIAASARASSRRLVRCRPSRSIVAGRRAEHHHLLGVAHRPPSATRARTSGRRRLESSRSPRARRPAPAQRSRSRQTAATTSGPARHPRPASSAPATRRTPSARSWANSRADGPVRPGPSPTTHARQDPRD